MLKFNFNHNEWSGSICDRFFRGCAKRSLTERPTIPSLLNIFHGSGIIALGTNDVKTKYGPPDAAEVVEGIDKIVKIIKRVNSGAKPIVLTPLPLGNVTSGDIVGAQDRIPPVVAEYRRYAATQNISIIDLYSTIDTDVDIKPDFVRLNHRGRWKIAVSLWDNLQGVLRYAEPI